MVGALFGGGKKGGSKQRVVNYFMSIHYGVCAGPIDKLWRLFYGEKEFWEGPLVAQTSIPIDNPNLMGGPTKEGGVSGVLYYLPGAADQEMPSELASRLGLTTSTCPGFRALASLFFVGPPQSSSGRSASGVRGFYWSANSPYLRGIWAEVQCIENHTNSYAWYPSKAAIPRIQDPVSEEVEEAILNPRLAQFTGAKTDPDNSLVLIEGATGNDATKWDTYGNIAVRAEQFAVEDSFQIFSLPDGTRADVFYGGVTAQGGIAGVHITRDGEIVIRDHDSGDFKFYDSAGTLIQTVAGGTLGQFGGVTYITWMDDIDVGGVTYMLAVTLAPFSTAALIRLRKEGVDWSKEEDRLATYVPSTLSLGPTYGYAIRVSVWSQAPSIISSETTTEVIRITLDSLAEVVVDLSSIVPGITNITVVGYDRDNDVVVVGCANGDLYTFSADLSTVVAAQTGNAFELAHRDALLGKRLFVGPSTIAVRHRPSFGSALGNQDVYKFTTPDLDLIETIDTSARAYPAFDQDFYFQANNVHWNGMFLPTHFFKSPFWFLGVAPRYDMNPAHIVLEALTNKRWGMGQPIASIDTTSFQDAADTLYTEQLGLSMMWTRQATIERFVGEVLDHIEATLYIAPQTGLLTLKLLRDDYDPDTLTVYDEDNSTCIEFQRKSMADIINEIVVSYTDPQNEKAKTVTRQDLAGIAAQGGIVSDSRDYYGVRSATMAGRLADRDLRAGGYPLATAIVEADRSGWDLVPGAVIKFSSVEHGVSQIVMRVLSVDYGRPGEPRVRLELVEDVFSLEVAEFVQPPPGRWVDPGENPQPMDFTKLLTAPYMALVLAGANDLEYPEAIVGVLGATGGQDTHAYDLYGTVTDSAGVSRLTFLGTNTVVARGSLGEAMAAEVETELDLGDLVDVSQGAQAVVGGFALIGDNEEEGDELALVTQVLGGVATLQRGVLDTVPRDWPVGRTIVFFTTTDRIYDATIRSAGESVRYKLLPRTSRGVLDLASAPLVPVAAFEISERPYLPLRPANVKVEDVAFGALDISLQSPAVTEFEVTWSRRNRLTEDSQPLAWDAADVTPEAGQLTRVNILDADTREVLTTFDNIAGTSQIVELTDFQAGLSPPPPVIIVQVQAINTTSSPPMVSLQAHEITVVVDPGVDQLALSGTPVLTGSVGIAYTEFTVTASGGAPPYSFTLEGDWPAGLEIDFSGNAAVISGTPTESGNFSTPGITVRVTDSLGDFDELTPFVLVIDDEDTTAPTLTNPTGGNVP